MAELVRVPLNPLNAPGHGQGYIFGDYDPIAIGCNAPLGMEFTNRLTGLRYVKTGAGSTDWAQYALTSGFLPITGGSLSIGASLTVPETLAAKYGTFTNRPTVGGVNVMLVGDAPTAHNHALTDAAITGTLPATKGGTGQAAAFVANRPFYASSTTAMAQVAIYSVANNGFLRQNASGVPAFVRIVWGDIDSKPVTLAGYGITDGALSSPSPTTQLMRGFTLGALDGGADVAYGRAVDRASNTYQKSLQLEFKTRANMNGLLGSGTYASVLTMAGYTDASGGPVWGQLGFSGDTLSFRSSTYGSAWTAWQQVAMRATSVEGYGIAGGTFSGAVTVTGAISLNSSVYIGGRTFNATGRVATDLNDATMRETGFYGLNGANLNSPYTYAAMIVARNSDVGLQIAGGYQADNLYFRGWHTSGTVYTAWRTVLHNGNIATYAGVVGASRFDGHIWRATGVGNLTIENNAGTQLVVISPSNGWLYAQYGLHIGDANNGNLSFSAQTRQMLNLYGSGASAYGIGVQGSTAYFRTGGGFAWYSGGVHNDAQWNNGGGTSLMTLDSTGTLGVAGSIIATANGYVRNNLYINGEGNAAYNLFGKGLVGTYNSYRYQGVFAMGAGYELAADGTAPGTLYGLAWTHENIGGQSKAGLSHQLLIMENGVTKVALGTGMWTNGYVDNSTAAGGWAMGDKMNSARLRCYSNAFSFLTSANAYASILAGAATFSGVVAAPQGLTTVGGRDVASVTVSSVAPTVNDVGHPGALWIKT